MNKTRYNIGQMVQHKKQGYIGIVVDVDACFQPSGKMNPHIDPQFMSKKGPWYRLLVHDSELITYVDEGDLHHIEISQPIHHPELHHFLIQSLGIYQRKGSTH